MPAALGPDTAKLDVKPSIAIRECFRHLADSLSPRDCGYT